MVDENKIEECVDNVVYGVVKPKPKYDRITPERVVPLYKTLDVKVTDQMYQVVVGDSLISADPIGILYYLEEGLASEHEPAVGYLDLAMVLDLPIEYVIGFDISFSGEQVREQVVAAGLDTDLENEDLWYGSADGAKCRIALLVNQEQEVASE